MQRVTLLLLAHLALSGGALTAPGAAFGPIAVPPPLLDRLNAAGFFRPTS